jgi:hypothetical protein
MEVAVRRLFEAAISLPYAVLGIAYRVTHDVDLGILNRLQQ